MNVLLFGESALQLKGVEVVLLEAGHHCEVLTQADSVLEALEDCPSRFDCVLCSDPACLSGGRLTLLNIRDLHPDTSIFCIFFKTSPDEELDYLNKIGVHVLKGEKGLLRNLPAEIELDWHRDHALENFHGKALRKVHEEFEG